jgi:RNA polymerase sigma-70 factor (TIGR02943 family)
MADKENKLDIGELVEMYSDALYGFACARVKNTDQAKDFVQETFIKAYENSDKLATYQSVKSWLFTVLRNLIIDHYRSIAGKAEKRTVDAEDYQIFFNEKEVWNNDQMPLDWLSGIDNQKEEEFIQLSQWLQKCIEELKELPSAVIRLRYLDEQDGEEICKVLNLSTSNYWVIIHRAKLKLRKCLEKISVIK